MLKPREILAPLAAGHLVPGRHVLVTAHADDEALGCAQLLSSVYTGTLVVLTTGADRTEGPVIERRRQERAAAAIAGQWWGWAVREGQSPGRHAHEHLEALTRLISDALDYADVVWTHPYEGGHLDHDTAAWLVQRACADRPVRRMEFASYHATKDGQCFGDVVPDSTVAVMRMPLSAEVLARKRAALAMYVSQADILRKFTRPEVEVYREAPIYDFTRPSPAARCRWDVKGYTPSTADWRAHLARAEALCVS